jgi:dTDP-4-amino-4,6-dideoxygalactose transaminase
LIHYPIPPHLQQAYADLGQGRDTYPLAEKLADTVLSLPMGPHLPESAVDEIAQVVRKALGQ